MAYPSLYDLDYSYSGFAAGLGDGSFPGSQLDNDLAGLTAAQQSFSDFLQGAFRSDGVLNISALPIGTDSVSWASGEGSPEGVREAPVGSLWTRTDGGAGTTLYVKEAGTGNTGWAAK
jgi:hypothetical protein